MARSVPFNDRPLQHALPVSVGASWELALRHGPDSLDLGYHEFFGFGVNAGMACFVDADACDQLSEVWRDLDGLVEPRDDVIGAGKMVAWSSGWGDGTYPTWIGRDARGTVACFVAHMLLFPAGSPAPRKTTTTDPDTAMRGCPAERRQIAAVASASRQLWKLPAAE